MGLMPLTLIAAAAAATVYTPIDAATYTYLGTGGCRGNGGATDKVNAREAEGLTQAECEAACTAEATCVGYSHKVGGWCMLYGPGLHGTCPDTTKKLQSQCGTCSVASAIDSAGCTNAAGTWTDGGWDGPEIPFTGDGHLTTHVHAAHTPASGADMDYPCFDHNDFLSDHLAKCTGTGSSGQDCKTVFDAADDYLIASCPGAEADAAALEADAAYVAVGCTYTAAPAFTPKPPHAPDMKFPGWNAAMPGACRSSCGPGGESAGYQATCDTEKKIRPGTKWCKNCGANAARMTQHECMMACEVEPSCIGYHSGPWCSVYGPGPELWNTSHPSFGTNIPAGQTNGWGGSSYPDDTGDIVHGIDATKPNIEYICLTPCGDTPARQHTTTHAACLKDATHGHGSRYHYVGSGGCRGNGGRNDFVNSKGAQNFATQALCEAECDNAADNPDCVGYIYQEASPNWCSLYGPGMAGHCTDYPSLKTKMACENNGACSDTTKLTEASCGACSDGVTTNNILCGNVDETWTALAWSATPGTWAEPDTTIHAWEGDSHATDHIDQASASAGHKCFEIVNDDHIAQCHGSDSHADATESDTKCHAYFSSFNTLEEANCPLGCVFVAEPEFTRIIHPHPADIKLPGWKPARSGACRKIVPGSCPSAPDGVCRKSPNGKYGKTPGNPMNKDPLYGGMTQAECAAACVAEPTCFAYHHGPWCSVFGEDIHLTPDSEVLAGYGTGWGGNPYYYEEANDGSLKANDGSSLIANSGDQALKGNSGPWMAGDQVLSIDSTKENIEYICVEMADDHPVAIQRATIAANEATIAANVVDIATKDAAIVTKDATIAANEATIAANVVDIAAKDATIAAAPEAKDEGVEDGAAAGIAIATFLAGLLIGTIIISMILCPAARQQKAAVTKSTAAGVKVEQVGQVGI
jgi:hypothetical protein